MNFVLEYVNILISMKWFFEYPFIELFKFSDIIVWSNNKQLVNIIFFNMQKIPFFILINFTKN